MAARLKKQGGVCWLCGGVIATDLPHLDPMAFTLDHVIPVSLGGAVDDPRNVRPAHRACNMKRGTGRGKPRTAGDRSAGW